PRGPPAGIRRLQRLRRRAGAGPQRPGDLRTLPSRRRGRGALAGLLPPVAGNPPSAPGAAPAWQPPGRCAHPPGQGAVRHLAPGRRRPLAHRSESGRRGRPGASPAPRRRNPLQPPRRGGRRIPATAPAPPQPAGHPGDKPMSDKRLAELSRAVGLNLEWQDAAERDQSVSPEAQRSLLEAMGYPVQSPQQIMESLATLRDRQRSRPAGPLLIAEQGQSLDLAGHFPGNTPFRLVEEMGQEHSGRLDRRGRLPAWQVPGYHRVEIGDESLTVAVCPPACPDIATLSGGRSRRIWGLAAQLYALRRPGDGGLGDTEALEQLARSAAQAGADALALSPVHAMFSALPEHYSP